MKLVPVQHLRSVLAVTALLTPRRVRNTQPHRYRHPIRDAHPHLPRHQRLPTAPQPGRDHRQRRRQYDDGPLAIVSDPTTSMIVAHN
ncbi:hypothetical protein APR12_006325 [Nocardia amikacinitolerans]|nr:hypothetical protein [Nocardia amikacinitolerans]